jgi:hypothetical protein
MKGDALFLGSEKTFGLSLFLRLESQYKVCAVQVYHDAGGSVKLIYGAL